MATSETSPIFCVRGTVPPPRPRPRKVTNSEKTFTTNNLSQHKYLKLKRQLQQDAENTPIATGDVEFQNRDQSLRSETAQDRRQKQCVSNTASYSMQHQYRLVSDWNNQWHSLYHHFTTHNQPRHPSSYQGSLRETTSHLSKGSELPKLLTSTHLSPQVPANHQNTALCNLQHPQSSGTSDSGASSEEDPLGYDQSMDIAPDNDYDSCNELHEQYRPMTRTESFLTSTVYVSSNSRTASSSASWYSEYLRATLQQMHARTRSERKKTRSAPGDCVSMLMKDSKERPQLFTSTTITYFSQRDIKRPPREHGVVDFDILKAEKTKEVLSKPPPFCKPDPKPRSHWYEMRTPDFHVEARRNNNLIRKSCNW